MVRVIYEFDLLRLSEAKLLALALSWYVTFTPNPVRLYPRRHYRNDLVRSLDDMFLLHFIKWDDVNTDEVVFILYTLLAMLRAIPYYEGTSLKSGMA